MTKLDELGGTAKRAPQSDPQSPAHGKSFESTEHYCLNRGTAQHICTRRPHTDLLLRSRLPFPFTPTASIPVQTEVATIPRGQPGRHLRPPLQCLHAMSIWEGKLTPLILCQQWLRLYHEFRLTATIGKSRSSPSTSARPRASKKSHRNVCLRIPQEHVAGAHESTGKHVRACIVYTWDHKSSQSFWSGMKVYVYSTNVESMQC
jgi:hypothetical protein